MSKLGIILCSFIIIYALSLVLLLGPSLLGDSFGSNGICLDKFESNGTYYVEFTDNQGAVTYKINKEYYKGVVVGQQYQYSGANKTVTSILLLNGR
jgi:hypothetical protein